MQVLNLWKYGSSGRVKTRPLLCARRTVWKEEMKNEDPPLRKRNPQGWSTRRRKTEPRVSQRRRNCHLPLLVERTYLRDGDVLSSTSTSGLAEGTTAWPPEIISFAVICLPYKALLASSSVSIEAPSSETPANKPFERE